MKIRLSYLDKDVVLNLSANAMDKSIFAECLEMDVECGSLNLARAPTPVSEVQHKGRGKIISLTTRSILIREL